MFNINPQSGVPIYRQLMDQIRRMIASGRLQCGAELPSVRQLALEHAVNTMTISKAYSLLEAEGLLQRQRGKAMTVSAQVDAQQSRKQRLALLSQPIEQLVGAARQLDLPTDDVLQAVRQQMVRQQMVHQQMEREKKEKRHD